MSFNSDNSWSQYTDKRLMMKVFWIYILANASLSLSSSHHKSLYERVVNKRHVKNMRQKANCRHNINDKSFCNKLLNKNKLKKMCLDAKYQHDDEVIDIDSAKNVKKMVDMKQKYPNVNLRDNLQFSTKDDTLMMTDSSGYERAEQMRFEKKNEEYFQKLLEAIENINSETIDMALGHKNQSKDKVADDLRKLEDSKQNEDIYRRLVLFKNQQNLQRRRDYVKLHEDQLIDGAMLLKAHLRPTDDLSKNEKSLIFRKMQAVDDNECIYKGLRHAKDKEFREKHPGCLIMSDEEQLFEKQSDLFGLKTSHEIHLKWQSKPTQAEQQYQNHQRKLFLQSIPESLREEMLRQELEKCRKMYHGDRDIEHLLANITRIEDLPPSLHETSGTTKLKTLLKPGLLMHKKTKDRLETVNQGESLSNQNLHLASTVQTQQKSKSESTIQKAEIIERTSQNEDNAKLHRNDDNYEKPKELNIHLKQCTRDHTETIQSNSDPTNTHIRNKGYHKDELVRQDQRSDCVLDFNEMLQSLPTYANTYKENCETHKTSQTQPTREAFSEEQDIELAYVQHIHRIEKINYKHLYDLSKVHSKHLKAMERVHGKYMQDIKQIRDKHELGTQRCSTGDKIRSLDIANLPLSPSHVGHLKHVTEIKKINADYEQQIEKQHSKYTAAIVKNNKVVSDNEKFQHACSTESC